MALINNDSGHRGAWQRKKLTSMQVIYDASINWAGSSLVVWARRIVEGSAFQVGSRPAALEDLGGGTHCSEWVMMVGSGPAEKGICLFLDRLLWCCQRCVCWQRSAGG